MKLLISIILLNIVNIGLVHSSVSQADQQIILDNINEVRRNATPTSSNMREVRWSDCLAQVVLDYQMTCPGLSFNADRNDEAIANECEVTGNVGENIFIASSITTYRDAILAWASEASNYDYDQNTCSSVCGNYAQLVTAEVAYVGCSIYDQAICGGSGISPELSSTQNCQLLFCWSCLANA